MTKNFDIICKGILGEMVTPAQPGQPAQPVKPVVGAPAQPVPPQAGAQPAAQQNSQMKDEDLLKLLADKLKDPNHPLHASLTQLLNPQQPNAANKPA